jgi:hypothetical protein
MQPTLIAISGKLGSGKDTVAKMIQYLLSYKCDHEEIRLDSSRSYASTSGWEVQRFAQNVKKIASMLTGVPEAQFEDQAFKQQNMPAMWDRVATWKSHPGEVARMYDGDMDAARVDGWKDVPGENRMTRTTQMPMTYRDLLQKIGTDAMRDNVHQNVWVNSLFANYDRLNVTTDTSEPTVKTFSQAKWIISDMRFPNEFEAVHARNGICLRVERPGLAVTSSHISETALDDHKFDYYIQNTGNLEYLLAEVRQFLFRFDLLPAR